MGNSKYENGAPTLEMVELLRRVEALNIRLSEPARSLVLEELSKAMDSGIIETVEDQVQGAAALIAAGAQTAGWPAPSREPELNESAGPAPVTIVLEPSHLREGWMALAGGNHPPHRCFRRTVLEQVAEVEEALPLFRVLRGETS
jgi:hypothetical protein